MSIRENVKLAAIAQGRDVKDVIAELGHAHLSSTQVYLPHQTSGLAAAMDGRRYGPG